MEGNNVNWYSNQSIEFTYPCCKFGFEYVFYKRDKNITKWCSVQNMDTFDANIITILWEEKVQSIRFALWLGVCVYVNK
jgi:hypothetical protein